MKYKKFQVSELGFNNFFTILSHLIYTEHLFHRLFDIKNVQKARVNIFFKCIDFLLPSIPHSLFYRKHKNELNEKSFSSMKAFLAFDQKIFDILLSSTFWWREKSHKNRNYYIHAVLVISHQHKNYHLYELKERHFKDPSWYSWCGKSSKSI